MKKSKFILSALAVVACVLIGCGRKTSVVGKKSPTSGSILVRSHPAGMRVYLFHGTAQSYPGQATREECLIGETPLEAHLEPGAYLVTVKCKAGDHDLRSDGETDRIFQLTGDGPVLTGRQYGVDLKTGHKALITSLFWKKEQLPGVAKVLPDRGVYDISDEPWFKARFRDRQVPEAEWAGLMTMFHKAGKLVWYSPDESRHLFIYISELEPAKLLVVDPVGEPNSQAVSD